MKNTGIRRRLSQKLKKATRLPRLKIKPMEGLDSDGKVQYYWALWSANNRNTAGNHGHCSPESCIKGIKSVIKDLQRAIYEIER